MQYHTYVVVCPQNRLRITVPKDSTIRLINATVHISLISLSFLAFDIYSIQTPYPCSLPEIIEEPPTDSQMVSFSYSHSFFRLSNDILKLLFCMIRLLKISINSNLSALITMHLCVIKRLLRLLHCHRPNITKSQLNHLF